MITINTMTTPEPSNSRQQIAEQRVILHALITMIEFALSEMLALPVNRLLTSLKPQSPGFSIPAKASNDT
jgi:hypothetical protein